MVTSETFTTARLDLRKPRKDDAPLLFESYGQDKAVTRYLRWRPHRTVADSEAFVENALRKWETGNELFWFLFTSENCELIGGIAARIGKDEVELGYVLA